MGAFFRLAAAAAVILLYRYSLRLSTPQADSWYMVEYGQQGLRAIRRGYAMLRVWLIGLVRYIPTKQVQESWLYLRDSLQAGRYGEAGT